MAKKKKSKKDPSKAEVKARAKAAARIADLVRKAEKARTRAGVAAKAAERAQAKAVAAGAPRPEAAKPSEPELLRLALRSAEAKLTAAERQVEVLERQIADRATLAGQEAEESLEDALVDAAVEATLAEAVGDVEAAAGPFTTDAEAVEAVAVELDQIVVEAEPPAEADADGSAGSAADAAEVLAAAAPAVTAEEATPPLPAAPAADEPNASWTVLRLREEARARGLTGTSNLPKAALLDRLRTS